MIQSILSNLAVILLSHLVVTTLVSYRERFSKLTLQLSIILLMSITVISMFYLPVMLVDYRFDLRLIPLLMLAIFSGWRITIPVLVIACLWRYAMGGSGAIPGIFFGMAIPILFVLVYTQLFGNQKRLWDKVLVVTICWALSDIPLMFILDNGLGILKQIGPFRYISFLIAAFIYYTVIKIETGRLEMKRELEFLATHDQLTKLFNRQECIRRAEMKMKTADKNANHYMVMIDIDHFKKLNDEFGHAAGDEILVQMAEVLKSFETETVQAARYGGEEFMLWICSRDQADALEVTENIRQRIGETAFQVGKDTAISVTVSIGMASWQTDKPIHDAIKEADRKLYLAKNNGRNQLVV